MDAFTHSFGSNTSFDSHGGGIHHMAGIDDDSLICKHVDKQNQYILLQNQSNSPYTVLEAAATVWA
jgi:hypothetical protein